MRATIKHPADASTIATYGYDCRGLGYWIEVRTKGRLVAERDMTIGETSLTVILNTLVEHGFFMADDVADADAALGYSDVKDLEGGVAIAGEVLVGIRLAASSSG